MFESAVGSDDPHGLLQALTSKATFGPPTGD